METPLKLTIKVNKLDKTAFFTGKNGDTYCSLILSPNKSGEDEYGNTHFIKQDLGVERKDEKPNFCGNGRSLYKKKNADSLRSPDSFQETKKQEIAPDISDDEIPF